jgi:hypothetical protein
MDMPNRAMKILPAMLGGILAGLSFSAISQAAEPAKDCLTAPGQPTQGGHWYYRIDRPTKRHCWYVRAEGPAAAAQLASSSTEPAAAPVDAPLEPSVANARAEIAPAAAAPQLNQPNGSSATIAANGANGDAVPGGPQIPNDPSRTLAERWSDHPDANRPAEAAAPNMVANITPPPQPTSAKPAGDAADYSLWMLMSALLGALALVGVATAVITNFNRAITITRHDDPERGRSIWDAPHGDEPISPEDSAPVDAGNEAPMSWIRIARETQEARRLAHRVTDRRGEQIEQLLSQASRRPAV